MTHLMVLLDTIQKDNKNLRNEVKKKPHELLYLEFSCISTMELFYEDSYSIKASS